MGARRSAERAGSPPVPAGAPRAGADRDVHTDARRRRSVGGAHVLSGTVSTLTNSAKKPSSAMATRLRPADPPAAGRDGDAPLYGAGGRRARSGVRSGGGASRPRHRFPEEAIGSGPRRSIEEVRPMCRSITTLRGLQPPATPEEDPGRRVAVRAEGERHVIGAEGIRRGLRARRAAHRRGDDRAHSRPASVVGAHHRVVLRLDASARRADPPAEVPATGATRLALLERTFVSRRRRSGDDLAGDGGAGARWSPDDRRQRVLRGVRAHDRRCPGEAGEAAARRRHRRARCRASHRPAPGAQRSDTPNRRFAPAHAPNRGRPGHAPCPGGRSRYPHRPAGAVRPCRSSVLRPRARLPELAPTGEPAAGGDHMEDTISTCPLRQPDRAIASRLTSARTS